MEIALILLIAVGGGLISYILFGGEGPVEKALNKAILSGQRVVISIDDESTIFELIDGRVRITHGVTDYQELTDEPE